MVLTPRSGFSLTTSGQNDVPDEIPNTEADVLDNMPFVSNTLLNKYSIDSTQYPNTTAMLVGLMKGKRTNVTYYRICASGNVNNRTNVADLPTMRNVLDTQYQKILNLEITLPQGFNFTSNNAQASTTVTGQAMLYPNMNPNIGDIFTMGVGDGRIGVCRVSSVSVQNVRQDRIFTITFLVQQFLDKITSDPIEGSVVATFVFSKANYLGGTAALLSEQTYSQLGDITAIRGSLCQYFHQTFFDNTLCSYLRPDGVYDPWVVQFMNNKITLDDAPLRAKNLLGRRDQIYKQTLWARLEDRYNNTLNGILPCTKDIGYYETQMGVFVTELVGYTLVFPTSNTADDFYLYTINFYTGNVPAMTTEEKMVYAAVTQRTSGDLTNFLMNYLNTVYSLTPQMQFYKIPIYLHLIDMSLQQQYREIDDPGMNDISGGM